MTNRSLTVSLLFLIAFLGSASAFAKTFQNSYISFEMPKDWSCAQEKAAWICNPSNPVKERQAIVVLTSKVAGPGDTLSAFKAYLQKPKSLITKSGEVLLSKVLKTESLSLGGQDWIESVHLNSEVPDFQTVYLATVKEKLAILLSFSAEKNHVKVYEPIFGTILHSLKITASQSLLSPPSTGPASTGAAKRPFPTAAPATSPTAQVATPAPTTSQRVFIFILIGGLILLALLYFLLTKKR